MRRSGSAIRFLSFVTALFFGVAAIQVCVHGLSDVCDGHDEGLTSERHVEHDGDHDDAPRPKQHSHNDGDHHDGCTCLCHAPFTVVMISEMPDPTPIEHQFNRYSVPLAVGVSPRVERPPQASLLS